MQRVWVGSLVREMISHLPCGQKTQNIKERQYCDKFNKDLKKKKRRKKLEAQRGEVTCPRSNSWLAVPCPSVFPPAQSTF